MVMKNKINRFNENIDDSKGLDNNILYGSGDASRPGKRLRNFLGPYFSYFTMLKSGKIDKDHKIMKRTEEACIENLPYIRYWLDKIDDSKYD